MGGCFGVWVYGVWVGWIGVRCMGFVGCIGESVYDAWVHGCAGVWVFRSPTTSLAAASNRYPFPSTHTSIPPCTHTPTLTYPSNHIHKPVHPHIHAPIHAPIHTPTRARTPIHPYTLTPLHTPPPISLQRIWFYSTTVHAYTIHPSGLALTPILTLTTTQIRANPTLTLTPILTLTLVFAHARRISAALDLTLGGSLTPRVASFFDQNLR